MNMPGFRKVLAGLLSGIGLAAAITAYADEPLKVGFVYTGPIGDHGWTYQHEQGRKAIKSRPPTSKTLPMARTPNG